MRANNINAEHFGARKVVCPSIFQESPENETMDAIEECGFANSILSASVDPVFFFFSSPTVTANIEEVETEQNIAGDGSNNHAWKQPWSKFFPVKRPN